MQHSRLCVAVVVRVGLYVFRAEKKPLPLRPGDTLMVWKLDRLGRSLRDLITTLDDLRDRGVRFHLLTENIDTDTPTGRAMWQMIALLAELERSLIVERTRAGMQAARARGVRSGPKNKLPAQQIEHAKEQRAKGKSPDELAHSH